ncbi:MAG TPA: GNAT family N-acetyltransferase [Bacteroidota bacterium]|nr:GNAT family N-acetyltransferase [Bacteroidota bacterium]
MAISIRPATSEDNEQLIRLTKACPMSGVISLYVDREPDFFFLNRLQGEEWRLYVAEVGGEIVGSLGVAYRKARVLGEIMRMAYLTDVKIAPAYRGSTVAFRLLRELYENEKEKEFDIYVCSTLKGNDQVIQLFQGRAGIPSLTNVGEVSVVNVIPTYWFRLRQQWRIRRATEHDHQPIVELLESGYRSHCFAPVFPNQLTPGRNHDSPPIASYLVAERNGEIEAVAQKWDQGNYKRLVIVRHSGLTKSLQLVSQIGSIVHLTPPIPSAGMSLKVLQVRHTVCAKGREEALRQLLLFIYREAYRNSYHAVQLSMAKEDGLQKLVPGPLKVKIPLVVYCGSLKDPTLPGKIKGLCIYEDVSLV